MTVAVYAPADDPYCYPGGGCLMNRPGLRDPGLLEAFELEMSSLRAEDPLPRGRFGPAHYRAVHRHLFQDVYAWAGRYRTVRIAKEGNWFCFPENIASQMNTLFAKVHAPPFMPGADAESFVAAAADFLAELNAIHPFREGNGRAQLVFFHLLAERAGHPMRLEAIRRETFMPAMIASFRGDVTPLIGELRRLLG